MAENVVEILVRSKNDTRAGFDAAKRDAELAGDDAAQGFMARFGSKLASFNAGHGGGGFGEGGMFSSLGSFFTSPIGLAGAATGAAALLTELDGLASGFAAAGAGAGAFFLFAMPAFKQLQGDASSLVNLWDALQTAQNKLTVTQANFAADPTKANAAALTAAQKGLLTAQNNLQAAQLGMGQDAGGAATAVLQLRTEYDKLSGSLQGQAFQVLADGLQAVTKFLPALAPMAKAFGDAIGPLLQKLGDFAQSKGFKDWLDQFDRLIGPSTTAIGTGLGKVVVAFGELFTIMSKQDVVHAINIAFDTIAGILIGLRYVIEGTMRVWDEVSGRIASNWHRVSGAFQEGWSNVRKWTDDAVHWLETTVPGEMFTAASKIIEGFIRGLTTGHSGVLGAIQSIGGGIVGELDKIFHFGSPSKTMIELGRNVTEGFRIGLQSSAQNMSLGGSISGGAGAGGPIIIQLGGGSSSQLEQAFFNFIVKEARVRGGGGKNSVQIAFGQTH